MGVVGNPPSGPAGWVLGVLHLFPPTAWPLSGAGLPRGAPPLLPRARSERQESLGEGEECQVFVVEKICSPEFPPESTICWVFSRIMKHFLRGWRRREGLKKNGVSFLTSSLLSLEPFREASGIRRRGSGSGGGGSGREAGCQTQGQLWLCHFLDACPLVCFPLLNGDGQRCAVYLGTH